MAHDANVVAQLMSTPFVEWELLLGIFFDTEALAQPRFNWIDRMTATKYLETLGKLHSVTNGWSEA